MIDENANLGRGRGGETETGGGRCRSGGTATGNTAGGGGETIGDGGRRLIGGFGKVNTGFFEAKSELEFSPFRFHFATKMVEKAMED